MNKLYIILRSIIITCIIGRSWCDGRIVTLPYDEKDYTFNVTVSQRKAFKDVPVWSIETISDGNYKYNYEGIAKPNGVLYEDTAMKAILFEKNDCNSDCWEGVFGFGTKRNVISNKSLNKVSLRKRGGIYKSYSLDEKIKKRFMSPRKLIPKRNRNTELAQNFYAKLLIVIDNALFKKLGSNVEYATRYLSIFWSAVDLQYRNVTSPKIEVRITGLIIGKDDKALHYVSENSPDGSSVNIDEVLIGSKREKDFIKKTNLTNYDAVVTLTGLSGYAEVGPGHVKVGSPGVSWNATICMDDFYFSVTTDDGTYYGIHSATHELGHLLGLDHDAVRGNAQTCYPKNRRLLPVMWPTYEDREIEYWSECSLRNLKIFTNDDKQSWCLKSEVHQRN